MPNELHLSDDTKALLSSPGGQEARAALAKLHEMSLEMVTRSAAKDTIETIRYQAGVLAGIAMAMDALDPRR